MTLYSESPEDTGPRSGARSECRLHLPSLSIEGFRGIKGLTISRLGRVTLLAGRNGVGKTMMLDAVRIHASRAHLSALTDLLVSRWRRSPRGGMRTEPTREQRSFSEGKTARAEVHA